MQVKVHLGEGLLHVLDMVGGVADKVRPVSPVGTQDAYLVVGTKRTGQEPIGVETLEPLAVGDIALAARHVLHMAGIYELYLESVLFKDLVAGNPVDPGGLHGDGGDTAFFQPPGHGVEIGREATEAAYRLLIPVFGHGDPMLPGADIDARGVLVDHGEGTGAGLLLWWTLSPALFHRKTSLEWYGVRSGPGRPTSINLLNGIASPMGQPKTPGTMLQHGYRDTSVNKVLAAGM